MKAACEHLHGEYDDTYRHCLGCGREWVLIGAEWFVVEAWVRVSREFLESVAPEAVE